MASSVDLQAKMPLERECYFLSHCWLFSVHGLGLLAIGLPKASYSNYKQKIN